MRGPVGRPQQRVNPTGRGARSFEHERELVADDLARMGGLAESLCAAALDSVVRRDTPMAQDVVARHEQMDGMRRDLEATVVRLIAVWRPLAQDVLHLVSTLKISAHLARIGELACNVARRAVELNAADPLVLTRGVERMGRQVVGHLKVALDAHAKCDAEAAFEAWRRDDDVDDAYDSLFKDLVVVIGDDPRLTGPCTNLLFVAKNMERVGDHATEIAEIVYGLATGGELSRATAGEIRAGRS